MLILIRISVVDKNLFYITCFKGRITARRRLVYGIFWVEQNLMRVWIGCVGYSKMTMQLKTVDRVVMELWYRTVRSRTLHTSDEDKVDLKRLKS